MSDRGSQTRIRILNAARGLYSSHGSDGTTLDDIITASGVTKGAFYHYFKSKEALCIDLIELAAKEYTELIEGIDPCLGPLDKLKELVRLLDELNSNGKWVNCKLILRLSADSDQGHPEMKEKLRGFWHWYTKVFEEIITECQKAGELTNNIDAHTQTKMIMSLIAGAITFERIDRRQKGFEDEVKILIEKLSV